MVMSILGRLLGITVILGFVALMVIHTGKLGCLWLLWLLLMVDFIPVYDFETKEEKTNKESLEND
jgi:hypothetical protein